MSEVVLLLVPAAIPDVVADGNLLIAAVVAVLAGLVSFASPCVLPLVPGFLGYVTGLSATPLRERGRSRLLLGAALFVLGFSIVFILGTVLASAAGAALRDHQLTVSRIGGVLVIAMALVFLGWGGPRQMQPRWRPAAGLAGAPLLGVVFAIGWSPCMGPTLGAIMALATNLVGDTSQVVRGALLGAAYCIGLGAPFLLLAGGWSRANAASGWLRRHHRGVQLFGAAMLMIVGVMLVTGWWNSVVVDWQTRLVATFPVPL